MAFPTIPTAGASTVLFTETGTAGTTHTFPSLTTLDNANGDLLIAVIVLYQASATGNTFGTWGGSFTEFGDSSSATNPSMAMGCAYKISNGTETGTFTVTSSISGRAAMVLMSVKGYHGTTVPEVAFSAATTTTAQNPPTLNPSGWDVEDTLWIAVAAGGQTSLTGSWSGIGSAPANYTGYAESAIAGGDVIGACQIALAFRQLAAASDDPGSFTTDTSPEIERAATIAVRPAPSVVTGTAAGAGTGGETVAGRVTRFGVAAGSGAGSNAVINGTVTRFGVAAGAGTGDSTVAGTVVPLLRAYARAGGGNWSDASTWSLTPNGPADGVVPTAAHIVSLDASSGNVTIDALAYCRSLDCDGYTGTLTQNASLIIGDASAPFGNRALRFSAGMTYTPAGVSTNITFQSTSAAQQTVTTAGKVCGYFNFNGAGSSYLLTDALTLDLLSVERGTFDTGSQDIDARAFDSYNTNTRTLTFGSSDIAIHGTGYAFQIVGGGGASNCWFTANTATVTMDRTASLTGGPNVFSVNADTNGMSLVMTGPGAPQIYSATNSTWRNFTRTGTASPHDALEVAGGITATDTLTLTGNSLTNRLFVYDPYTGTGTMTVSAATTVLTNVDFMGIVAAGAAAWTGTSLGNALGNSGITFTPKEDKWAVAPGNWSSTATWATSNGGSPGAAVPLCHDDVYLTSSAPAGNYVIDMPRAGADLDCTGFTATVPSASFSFAFYGDITLAAGMIWDPSYSWYLKGRGAHTITSAGKIITGGHLFIDSVGGSYTLADDLRISYYSSSYSNLFVNAGTFNDNGKNIKLGAVVTQQYHGGTVPTTVNLTGTMEFLDTAQSNLWTHYGGTINADPGHTMTVASACASSRSLGIGPHSFGTLNYTVAGSTGALVLSGAGLTFVNVNFSDASNARTLTLPATANGLTVTGDFNVNGTAGKLMTVENDLTKASGVVDCEYLALLNSDAAGGATFYAGRNSTNTNSTGWLLVEYITGTAAGVGTGSGSSTGARTAYGTAAGTGTGDGTATGTVTGIVYGAAAGAGAGSGTARQDIGALLTETVGQRLLTEDDFAILSESSTFGTASGAGTSTGTATGLRTVYGTVAGTGTGGGTAVGSVPGTAIGTATGSGTATGKVTRYGVLSGAGTGASAVTGRRTAFATATATGTGGSSVTGTRRVLATAAGSGTGAGTATGTVVAEIVYGTATGAGAGSGSTTGVRTTYATAAATGAGDGTADGIVTGASGGVGQGSGAGAGTATGLVSRYGAATAAGTGAGAVSGTRTTYGTSSGSGAGAGTALGAPVKLGTASGSGAGAGTALGTVVAEVVYGTATGTGVGAGTAAGTVIAEVVYGVASGSGTGGSSATGTRRVYGISAGAGSSAGTATGTSAKLGTASATGTGSGAIAGKRSTWGTAAGAGAGTATVIGTTQGQSVGVGSGSGTSTGVVTGRVTRYGTVNSPSTGVGTALGRRIFAGTAAAASTGAGTAIGRTVVLGVAYGASGPAGGTLTATRTVYAVALDTATGAALVVGIRQTFATATAIGSGYGQGAGAIYLNRCLVGATYVIGVYLGATPVDKLHRGFLLVWDASEL